VTLQSTRRPRSLKSGQVALGIHLSFLSPELIEFCGLLGFDWVFLDAQRTLLDPRLFRDLVRAADNTGMFCVVRVPAIDAPMIEGYLDGGAIGIVAPDVSSAAKARILVDAVKFSPEGKRGASARSRAARYGLAQSSAEYCRDANLTTFTVALVESEEGARNLEEIMAVPGIDYLAIGPNDLGMSMGSTGGLTDPKVRAAVDSAQLRIARFGKPQMAVINEADQAPAAAANGALLIAIADASLLGMAGRSFLERRSTAIPQPVV
jgi:2-keto-3-deoxy-L-rhamnonate aldolase RhmA